MKYIKKYENVNEPDVGDYICVSFKDTNKIKKELESKIGRIIKRESSIYYKVEFGMTSWLIQPHEIVDFSKNKEDLDYVIKANTYNL